MNKIKTYFNTFSKDAFNFWKRDKLIFVFAVIFFLFCVALILWLLALFLILLYVFVFQATLAFLITIGCVALISLVCFLLIRHGEHIE